MANVVAWRPGCGEGEVIIHRHFLSIMCLRSRAISEHFLYILRLYLWHMIPPLWSSGQSFWLQMQRSRVRFPTLPVFLSSSWSGTGYAQPREVN